MVGAGNDSLGTNNRSILFCRAISSDITSTSEVASGKLCRA